MPNSIYGHDENDFAESIAREALGKPSSTSTSGNRSHGNDTSDDTDEVPTTERGVGSDSRAVSKGDCE